MPNRLIVLIYLLLTYSGGLWALLGSLIISLIARLAWRENWVDHLGLRVTQSLIWLVMFSLGIAAGVAWVIIPAACQAQGIALTPVWQRGSPLTHALHTIGQTYNEEIVLGWMLLIALRHRIPHLSKPALAILVALAFTGLHFVFYAARPAGYANHGVLSVPALLSIFAVGVLRNNLILSAGTIALAWAVHLGWNLIFIDSAYAWTDVSVKLSEPEIFNAIFGYPPVVTLLTLLMILSFLFFLIPTRKHTIDF